MRLMDVHHAPGECPGEGLYGERAMQRAAPNPRHFYLGPLPLAADAKLEPSRAMQVYNVARWYVQLRVTHDELFGEGGEPRRLPNRRTHFLLYIAEVRAPQREARSRAERSPPRPHTADAADAYACVRAPARRAQHCVTFRDRAFTALDQQAGQRGGQRAHKGGRCPSKAHAPDAVRTPLAVPARASRDDNPFLYRVRPLAPASRTLSCGSRYRRRCSLKTTGRSSRDTAGSRTGSRCAWRTRSGRAT